MYICFKQKLNIMENEDFVSYEIAEMLKTLGFDRETEYFYTNIKKPRLEKGVEYMSDGYVRWWKWNQMPNNYPTKPESVLCAAPTLYQTQKWFREVYSIDVTPYPELGKYDVNVSKKSEGFLFLEQFETYEEALLEGIKETCIFILNKN